MFALKKLKKTASKVAYLSKILIVSEIFYNTAQQPKWQNSCSKMWPIEQLYIELGSSAEVSSQTLEGSVLQLRTKLVSTVLPLLILNQLCNLKAFHVEGINVGYALEIWICGCSLFLRRELWASKSTGANIVPVAGLSQENILIKDISYHYDIFKSFALEHKASKEKLLRIVLGHVFRPDFFDILQLQKLPDKFWGFGVFSANLSAPSS